MPIKFENTVPLYAEIDSANCVFTDFKNGIPYDQWYIAADQWGSDNNGVHPYNVFRDDDASCAVLRMCGSRNGEHPLTGAVLVSHFLVQPGRYEMRFKYNGHIGTLIAMWTYFVDQDDVSEEIDIETPVAYNNNDYSNVNISIFNGSHDIGKDIKLEKVLNDGQFHTFGFDWYHDENNKKIVYYIDNVIIGELTEYIPFRQNRLWVGGWIPNKETIGGIPDFNTEYLFIDYISYKPFRNQIVEEYNADPGNVAYPEEYPQTSASFTDPEYIIRLNGSPVKKVNNKLLKNFNNLKVDQSENLDVDNINTEYVIYPKPIKDITYSSGYLNLENEFKLEIKETLDTATQNKLNTLLQENKWLKISQTGSKRIYIDFWNPTSSEEIPLDPDIALKVDLSYLRSLNTKIDGYYIKVTEDEIIIIGKDSDTVFYALSSLKFIFDQCNKYVRCLELEDYSQSKYRGFIEGYYGIPWTSEERQELMRFGSLVKTNVYIYAPKDDWYHANGWRTLYTPEDLAKLITQINVGIESKTRLVWAIHPFYSESNPFTREDYDEDIVDLLNKLSQVYDAGVRQFVLSADDIPTHDVDLVEMGRLHKDVLNDITSWLNTKGDCKNIIFVPTAYSGNFNSSQQDKENYFSGLMNGLNDSVEIMWTGEYICSKMSHIGYTDFSNLTNGRTPFIWMNWPVNDYALNYLLLGKGDIFDAYYLQDYDSTTVPFSGVVVNPMQLAEADKMSIWACADYTWNTQYFTSASRVEQSYHDSLKYIEPIQTGTFERIAEHLNNTGTWDPDKDYFPESSSAVPLINDFKQDLNINPNFKLGYENTLKFYAHGRAEDWEPPIGDYYDNLTFTGYSEKSAATVNLSNLEFYSTSPLNISEFKDLKNIHINKEEIKNSNLSFSSWGSFWWANCKVTEIISNDTLLTIKFKVIQRGWDDPDEPENYPDGCYTGNTGEYTFSITDFSEPGVVTNFAFSQKETSIISLKKYMQSLSGICDSWFLEQAENRKLVVNIQPWVLAVKYSAATIYEELNIFQNENSWSDAELKAHYYLFQDNKREMFGQTAPNIHWGQLVQMPAYASQTVLTPFEEYLESLFLDDLCLRLGLPTGIKYSGFSNIYSGKLENMIDGDDSTFCWFGNIPDVGSWIRFDIGKVKTLNNIAIKYGGSDIMYGNVQVSTDCKTWETVGRSLNANVNLNFNNKQARFIRILSTESSDVWVKVCEVSISGPDWSGWTTLTATYKVDGNTIDVQIYDPGEYVSYTADPVKLGYTFKGWQSEDPNFDITQPITSNQIFNAIFEESLIDDVPIIRIITENGANVTSKHEYVNANISIVSENPNWNLDNIASQVKLRGNSTLECPKKSFRIKFNTKQNVLGSSYKAKSWTLLANYFDYTLSRNAVCFDIARNMYNAGFVSSHHFVEVYLNDDYLGMYSLCDQIQANPNRVNVDENYMDHLNGNTGYLIERNNRALDPLTDNLILDQDCFNVWGYLFEIKTPDTEEQNYINNKTVFVEYIKDCFANCLNIANNKNWSELNLYMNTESFADMYILNEVVGNQDSSFFSFYLWKDVNGRLNCGPAWDFDQSLGNVNHDDLGTTEDCPYDGILTCAIRNVFFKYLLQVPEFLTLVKTRLSQYHTMILNMSDKLNPSNPEGYYKKYEVSFNRNFEKWDILGKYNMWSPKSVWSIQTIEGQMTYAYNWLRNRLNYIEQQYNVTL